MRQGNSRVIILLHLGTRSACSGIYLRTAEPYPTPKAVGFVSAVKHKPTCSVDEENQTFFKRRYQILVFQLAATDSLG